MSTLGPNSPGTGADDAGAGTRAWSNPGNVTASDDTRATATGTGVPSFTHYLVATGFGFAVPGTATVNSVLVEWERVATVGSVSDSEVKLVKAGVVQAADKSAGAAWPSLPSEAYASFTFTVPGDIALSPADVNDSGFGAAISASMGPTATAGVDHVRITITYTEAAGPGVRQIVRAVGIDPPPHPGGSAYRSALPSPTAMQLGGRATVSLGYDAPAEAGRVAVRVGLPTVAQGQLAGRVAGARGEDAPADPGGSYVARPPGPLPPFGPPQRVVTAAGDGLRPDEGRGGRVRPALIANPPSQKPARTVSQATAEERESARGSAVARSNPTGPAARGQPGGTVARAAGDGHPHEPGRAVSRAGRFEWPPPTRPVVSRGDDARPSDGSAAVAARSQGIPPPPATRLVATPADGAPWEPGRTARSPRPPAEPPPVQAPRSALSYGWGPQPEPGSVRVVGAVGLTNRLGPRPVAVAGDGPRPGEGRAHVGRVPTSPLVGQPAPGRVLQAGGIDAPHEAGRASRGRVPLAPTDAGSAGHVRKDQYRRVETDEPARVRRGNGARVARWPG